MTSLHDLDGKFIKLTDRPTRSFMTIGISYTDADGVMFLCPLCFQNNHGPIGTHSIVVWFADRDVPPEMNPNPRWERSGDSIDNLTLNPSIHILTGCGWHGFVKHGDAS